jgi:glycosyltransferase involved in cell wall biosynthesis
VTHLTPENYPSFRPEKGIYSVCYTVWETDRLPKQWVELINTMDEVWVPSSWNKELFELSGVTKPVVVIPHCMRVTSLNDAANLDLGVGADTYIFYSIFQWLERKNPGCLLKAYLTEFKPEENVCLVLKTYRLDTSNTEQNLIKEDISTIKKGLRLGDYPQLRFFGNLLSSEHMKGLHKRGDCFVLPHRAEGFGIPFAEAMAFGKPTIGSEYSGNLEFMDKSNSFLIKCNETPVYNMLFPHYNGQMTWGDPSVSHLKQLMRYCFTHREEAKAIAEKGRADIIEKLAPTKIADMIYHRLAEIERKL